MSKESDSAPPAIVGGNASVTAAGAFPDRFAGIASFHGGNLGTDKRDSPHLFVKI
jgi:carboxymethylenebutenolidase